MLSVLIFLLGVPLLYDLLDNGTDTQKKKADQLLQILDHAPAVRIPSTINLKNANKYQLEKETSEIPLLSRSLPENKTNLASSINIYSSCNAILLYFFNMLVTGRRYHCTFALPFLHR